MPQCTAQSAEWCRDSIDFVLASAKYSELVSPADTIRTYLQLLSGAETLLISC
jgi:hypothetical protein